MLGSQFDGIVFNVQFVIGFKGNVGGLYWFMGIFNSYIEFLNSGGLDMMYFLIVVMWIYFEGLMDGFLFNYGILILNFWRVYFWIVIGGNFFFCLVDRQGNMYLFVISFVILGQWYYVVVFYDYNIGVVRFWIDGVEKGKEIVGVF